MRSEVVALVGVLLTSFGLFAGLPVAYRLLVAGLELVGRLHRPGD